MVIFLAISDFIKPFLQTKSINTVLTIKRNEKGRLANIFKDFIILALKKLICSIWATSWENLFMPYANNKGTYQPAHLRNLISKFVVRCLDSIIPILAIAKTSILKASLCSWAGHLESYLVANPKDRISRDKAHIIRYWKSPSSILVIFTSCLPVTEGV